MVSSDQSEGMGALAAQSSLLADAEVWLLLEASEYEGDRPRETFGSRESALEGESVIVGPIAHGCRCVS